MYWPLTSLAVAEALLSISICSSSSLLTSVIYHFQILAVHLASTVRVQLVSSKDGSEPLWPRVVSQDTLLEAC